MNYKETSVFNFHEYEVELTGDQSPTLRPQKKESMHHMGGAAGESVYIYYEALVRYQALLSMQRALMPVHVLSFGFGMGYNEILSVVFFLKNRWDIKRLHLFSHEKDLFLYELFNNWLWSTESEGSVFDEVYLGIERATSSFSGVVSKSVVKENLKWLIERKQWSREGPVKDNSDFSGVYDVVFYDAFSSKTNDYLWTEDFLSELFRTRLNPTFVFSTYACTGVLKRVAAASKAQFIKRDGYKGKRNSSLIYRE